MLSCSRALCRAKNGYRQLLSNAVRPVKRRWKVAIFDPAKWSSPGLTISQNRNVAEPGNGGGTVEETLRGLKALGIKIAICTAEKRRTAEIRAKDLKILDMIDVMKCGDDNALIPKPHASNVDSICADTGVKPISVAVIGGTKDDMQLGKNANVGITIAISPDGSNSILAALADETVRSIEEIIPVLQKE